jgi:hypothetical protein
VFFKASESRLGAFAKARFAGRFFARKNPDSHLAGAGEAAGSGRKWQSAGELLEKSWQQFGIFARGPIAGVAKSLSCLLVWRDHGLADVVLAFVSISAGY